MDASPLQTAFELYMRSRNFYFDCLYAIMNCAKAKLMVLEVPMKYFLVTNVFFCAVQWLPAPLPISVVLSLIFFYYIRGVFLGFSCYRQSRIRVNELRNYCKRMMHSVEFHRLVFAEELPIFRTGGVSCSVFSCSWSRVDADLPGCYGVRLLFAESGRSH